MNLLKLWFGFSLPVGQRAYVLSGFGLMLLKYAIEAAAAWAVTGQLYTPLDFLDPRTQHRQAFFMGRGALAPVAMLALSLPCLWIALSMSIRRAVDVGHSAAFGLLVLVPAASIAAMLYLAALPSDPDAHWVPPGAERAHAPVLRPAMIGIAVGAGVAAVLVPLSIYAAREYGVLLFVATPLVSTAAAAYAFNRPFGFSLRASLAVAEATVVVGCLALLLFALEGALCIAMALPVAAVVALFGGMLGHLFASRAALRGAHLLLLVCFVPLSMGAEHWRPPAPLREVVTRVEIDAPPEAVWPQVIGFPPLTDPPPWYFRAGIAFPVRAEISGEGVGAVRHCVFSTGAFVEPITVWDPPHRLAFDVTAQPPPMRELSPWGDIAAPHLEGTLTSRRGEFRLVALEGGRTRLEGSTWYTLDMYPQAYWSLWSDALIHAIHLRVLEHVERLSEGAR